MDIVLPIEKKYSIFARNKMRFMMIENPFITYGYESADYFCDRKQETHELITMPVALQEYETFAKKHFEKAGKEIADGVVSAIYERFDGTTWYLQKVLNQLFATKDNVDLGDEERAVRQIVNQNEDAYKDLLYQLTARQRDLLVAVSREGKAKQITGAAFVKRYNLSSASSVQKSAQTLMEKQLLTHHQGVYEVYNKFMALWLRES